MRCLAVRQARAWKESVGLRYLPQERDHSKHSFRSFPGKQDVSTFP